MTSCDEPYIGDESIIRPPASTKLRMTSAQASRATGSSPTLKVIQLPRPTTGSASPVDGIGRVRIARGWAVQAKVEVPRTRRLRQACAMRGGDSTSQAPRVP